MRQIDVDKARECFEVRDGGVFWTQPTGNRARVGQRFGALNSVTGYRQGFFQKKGYREHQIVFAILHGYIPAAIDHINGNRSDNSPENLRAASKSQNMMNARLRANNSTGCKGVYWDELRGKFKASITADKKTTQLGYFEDFELACLAADEARDLYHGEFARHK